MERGLGRSIWEQVHRSHIFRDAARRPGAARRPRGDKPQQAAGFGVEMESDSNWWATPAAKKHSGAAARRQPGKAYKGHAFPVTDRRMERAWFKHVARGHAEQEAAGKKVRGPAIAAACQ
ncbi:MAG: hypothetical protein KGK12_00455 [Armatimonadetes bacterium]|nr:hypothetical protein [Armatimonadota bacterium]